MLNKIKFKTMKKLFLLSILAISLASSITIAQTNVLPGNVSGTWTKAGSPYNIEGNINIPNDSILIIQPGVIIIFQNKFHFDVEGCLLAVGTNSDSIIFTSADTTNGWRGIHFGNTAITNDTSKIKYCKFQYGKATGTSPYSNGGAMCFNNFSKALINNCLITNCFASGYGGGIYCTSSSPIISNNYITNNKSGYGIIQCDSGSSPYINNNIFSNNKSIYQGAIVSYNSSAFIINNTIMNNKGDGIFCYEDKGLIQSNTIIHNSKYGLELYYSSLTIDKNNISKNFECGIYLYNEGGNTKVNISNNKITYNSTTENGGGIYIIGGSGIITINNNMITNNSASSNGGGIYCFEGILNMINNLISNNTATSGGGIYRSRLTGNIINNTITNNSATEGGALYCISSSPSVKNSILWGNTATSGSQVFLFDETSDPNFINCDIQAGKSAFELNFNNFTGNYISNIDTIPQFVLPSEGSGINFVSENFDWSLQKSSLCIDSGDTAQIDTSLKDIEGNNRISVCLIDIGAYEYQKGLPLALALTISNPILCNGNATGVIKANTSGGNAAYKYLWNNGGIKDSIADLIAGNYSLTVSDTISGCQINKNITITQPDILTIDAGADKTIICGGKIQFDYPITNYTGSGILSYSWLPKEGLDSAKLAQPTSEIISDKTYTLSISTPNACVATDSVKVTVYPLRVNSGADKTIVCGGKIQFDNPITNYTSSGILSYSWLPKEGLDSAKLAQPTAEVTKTISYKLTVTTSNGCIANDSIVVFYNQCTNIEKINNMSVLFYPNPANDKLYFKETNYSNSVIKIFDLQGKQVLYQQLKTPLIDISNISKGIYTIKLINADIVKTAKFIKE
jgi:parallel beta-helix repeat protein